MVVAVLITSCQVSEQCMPARARPHDLDRLDAERGDASDLSVPDREIDRWPRRAPGSTPADSGARARWRAARSRHRGRLREWLVRVEHEHDQRPQIRGAAAGGLHRRVGAVPGLRLASGNPHYAVGRPEALLSGQHIGGLGARMAVHGRDAARGAAGLVHPEQVGATGLPRTSTRLP